MPVSSQQNLHSNATESKEKIGLLFTENTKIVTNRIVTTIATQITLC